MFCKNCGNQIEEGAAFCTTCGASVQQDGVVSQVIPAVQAKAAVAAGELSSLGTSALVFGILSVCFGTIPGLIFAIVGRNKAKKYQALAGQLNGKANIGNILSTVGLIYNIIATILVALAVLLYILYFLIIIMTIGASSY